VGVPFVQEMRFEQASISDLDSSRPEEFSSIVVSMSSDDYEHLHLEGQTQMFSPSPKTRLTGSIEAFALPPLSPLTDMEIGFVIDTGQLDGDVDVRVAEGKIEGFLDLRMNLLRVTATDRERLKPFESSLYEGLRLHQMVFLMTDKHGVMPIRVPVSGDARSPTFSLDIDMNSAVRKAVGNVVAFVVAPIISSIFGGTRAKRPRLAAVYFERGSDNLEERARDRLVRVAATLVAEPERMVTICGIAIKRDAQNRSNTTAEELERELGELARRRAARVRAHLIEQHSIEPRRLVACRPERTSALRPQVNIR